MHLKGGKMNYTQKDIEKIAWNNFKSEGKDKKEEKKSKFKEISEKVSKFGDRWNKATEGFWYNPEKSNVKLPKEDTDIMKQLFPDSDDNDILGLDKMDLGF